jgi:hypothetical protein
MLGLTVFDTAPGVTRVATFADFQREVARLLTSEAAFAEAAARQIAVADEWGTLDGQSTARISRVIEELSVA